MTLEDLMLVYDAAILGRPRRAAEHRIGVKAVVEALRDELSKCDWDEGENMIDALNEILASDGEVKAAGGSTREDERQSDAVVSLYTAKDGLSCTPAADFCQWEKLRTSWGFKTSCSTKWLMNENYGGDTCPLCEKAIKYKFPEGSE